MGSLSEKRKVILDEMEAGQGSARIFHHPVSLEPPFKPFNPRPEPPSFFKRLFQDVQGGKSYLSQPTTGISRPQFIRVKPSRDDENSLEGAEQFLLSLPASSPLSFEIIGLNKKVFFQMAAEESQAQAIISQWRSHFPNTDACLEKDMLDKIMFDKVFTRAYRLKNTHFFPLCLSHDFDPYRAICGILGSLDNGQIGVFQIIFMPVTSDWQENMKQASRGRFDPSRSPFVDLPQLPKSVDKKIAKPLFAVAVRMLASREDDLATMQRSLKQFENGENGLLAISGHYPPESILARDTYSHGMILNAEELSYLVHLPVSELLESMPCIEKAVKSYPVPDEYTIGGPVLGYNLHKGVKRPVCHSPLLPNQHVYAAGKSGYGKSNLILYSAMQRIEAGQGVGIIDPHGSLIKEGILPRIPKERIDDVIYFNAGDFDYPMAINPLAHNGSKLEKEHIRADTLSFFEDLFEMNLGVNVQHALNFFIITLLNRQDSTLRDIERLMIDKNWRSNFIKNIDDERILSFWEYEFPQLEKRGIITAITNKLSPLILPDSTIGPMLSQRENKIDFLDIMNRKKIFLCNLSHGDIGKRNSQLLGKLLVSKIQIAAMMREKGHCPDFYLYIDEFQHMTCPSMADILSGARKYVLHLWLTNQMIGDIPESIMRHIFNASTMIFFATDSPSDQTMIEKNLSKKFRAEEVGQLKRGEALVKMVASSFNMTTERVPEPPSANYVNEIIAASRDKYTVKKETVPPNQITRDEKISVPETTNREPKPEQKPETTLSNEEKAFLDCAFQNPLLSVTNLYKKENLSAYMGDKLKKTLIEKGMVKEVTTHLGAGSRIAKFLLLTKEGFNSLDVSFEAGSGKGGPLHRYWQSVIKLHAEGKGYKARIEESVLENKEAVDLGLELNGKRTAVEISITTRTEHEIGNTKKCLIAGYGRVIILFLEESKMAEFQNRLQESFTKEEQEKISVSLVYDFCRFL